MREKERGEGRRREEEGGGGRRREEDEVCKKGMREVIELVKMEGGARSGDPRLLQNTSSSSPSPSPPSSPSLYPFSSPPPSPKGAVMSKRDSDTKYH